MELISGESHASRRGAEGTGSPASRVAGPGPRLRTIYLLAEIEFIHDFLMALCVQPRDDTIPGVGAGGGERPGLPQPALRVRLLIWPHR